LHSSAWDVTYWCKPLSNIRSDRMGFLTASRRPATAQQRCCSAALCVRVLRYQLLPALVVAGQVVPKRLQCCTVLWQRLCGGDCGCWYLLTCLCLTKDQFCACVNAASVMFFQAYSGWTE
jgi:hypothetical protein